MDEINLFLGIHIYPSVAKSLSSGLFRASIIESYGIFLRRA